MMNNKSNNYWFPRSLLLSAGHFFSDIFPGFLAPILPLLMVQFGFSLTFAGLLAAAASLSGSLVQPVFGFLSDRLSTRFFVIMGPVFSATFYCTMGYMPDKWILLLWILCGGLGQAQFHPLGAKMTYDISEKNRGKVMSIFISGGSIGFSTGPLVVTALIAYRDIYFVPVAIIPAVMVAFLMYRFSPKHTVVASSGRKEIPNRSHLKLITSISIFVFIGLLRSFVIMSFNIFIPILYSFRGYSLEAGGFAAFLLHFTGGVGTLIGGFLTDWVDPKKIISGSFLLAAPALILFLDTSGIISYCALGVAGITLFASIPAVITQAQATMPSRMSTVSSMVMGVSWGVGGLLVSIVGWAADIFGLLPTLYVLAYFPFIGFGLSLLLHFQSAGKTRYPEYV